MYSINGHSKRPKVSTGQPKSKGEIRKFLSLWTSCHGMCMAPPAHRSLLYEQQSIVPGTVDKWHVHSGIKTSLPEGTSSMGRGGLEEKGKRAGPTGPSARCLLTYAFTPCEYLPPNLCTNLWCRNRESLLGSKDSRRRMVLALTATCFALPLHL